MTASDKLAELYSATQLFHLSKPPADVRSAQIQTLCYQLHELLSTVDDLRGLAIAVLDRKTGKDIVDRIVCCHDALDSLDSNEDDNAFVAAASSDSDEGSSTDDQDSSIPIGRTSRTAGKQTTESISINNSSTKRQTNTRHCRTKSLSRVAASDSQPKPSSVTSSLPSIPDLLTQLYGMKVKICDLFTNVPTDLHTVTARLRMRNQGKVIPAANDNTAEVSHISTSFGEITLDGFDKILHYLMEQVPPELQLGTESSFLDVGSGFGQCVLHTRIRCAVQTTRGIEYVPIRHQKAQELLQAVSTMTRSALSQLSWAGIELAEGDANAEQYREWLNAATHIYMFDARFSETCKRSLLKSIASCDYRVLACFDPPDHVRELVGDSYSLIGQISGLVTTGGNHFTCYFYKHAPRVSIDQTEGSGNSYTSISSAGVRAILPISIIDTQTSNSDSERSNASSSSDSDEEFDQPRKRAKHIHSVAHTSVHSTEELQAILVAELCR